MSRHATSHNKENHLKTIIDRSRAKSPSHLMADASVNYTEKLNDYLASKRLKCRVTNASVKMTLG